MRAKLISKMLISRTESVANGFHCTAVEKIVSGRSRVLLFGSPPECKSRYLHEMAVDEPFILQL